MPVFEIESEICLGFSHFGGVYNDCCGEVELFDEETEQLVKLMRDNDSSDMEDLELEDKFPEIFNKLDKAYREAAYKAEEEHWLDEGYQHMECHQYDDADMIEYLQEKGAWDFEYDEEEFTGEDGQLDEDALTDAQNEYLHEEALDNYLTGLHGEERYDFLRNKVGIDVDVQGCDYKVEIPQEIINLAFPKI